MGPMHVAETQERARRNCDYGLRWQYEYLSATTAARVAAKAQWERERQTPSPELR